MNEIIQNLEVNATNGKENFCYISEKQLKAMKELSKRETKENKQLEQKCKKQKEAINKIDNYINNYDVFKVFSFPLMKRWEEQQVKSSIDYEFKTSLVKDLKDILNEVLE